MSVRASVSAGVPACRSRLTPGTRTSARAAGGRRGPCGHLGARGCVYVGASNASRRLAPRVWPFTAVRAATMASADFCRASSAPRGAASSRHASRSPRVRRVTFAPSTRRIYAAPVRMTSGFESSCPLAHQRCASSAVRAPRAGALPAASFRPPSRGRRCRSARGSCHRDPQRTCTSKSLPDSLSLSVASVQSGRYTPCLAHTKKRGEGQKALLPVETAWTAAGPTRSEGELHAELQVPLRCSAEECGGGDSAGVWPGVAWDANLAFGCPRLTLLNRLTASSRTSRRRMPTNRIA